VGCGQISTLLLLWFFYIYYSGTHEKTWAGFSLKSFREWLPFLNLAVPSRVSVCLEWRWYEFMTIFCGYLSNPRSSVASMGVLIQITSLMYIFPYSLNNNVSTRVGNMIGAQKPSQYFCWYWDEKIIQYIYVCVCARVMPSLSKISESVTSDRSYYSYSWYYSRVAI